MNDLTFGFWLALVMCSAGAFSVLFGNAFSRHSFEAQSITGIFAGISWFVLAVMVLQP